MAQRTPPLPQAGKELQMQYALPRRTLKWMSKSIAALVLAQILCGSMNLVFADQSQPDPAGTATGDKFSVADAAGNPFVVPEPTDKSAPDYAKSKKDFEEFQAQAAREPLALKLADGVGHIRIAANFSWTLLTGYLVLFMQACFALLTCGLVRMKNAAHLMMLNFAAYVFAFLAYYAVGYAFQFGAVAVNAAPSNLGGVPTLNHFLIGSGQCGFFRFIGSPQHRRFMRDGAGPHPWATAWQVWRGWKAASVPGFQHCVRRYRHVSSALWVDGFQSRIDARCNGPSHLGCSGEYKSRGSGRLCRSDASVVQTFWQA